jgi:hypothetical protein
MGDKQRQVSMFLLKNNENIQTKCTECTGVRLMHANKPADEMENESALLRLLLDIALIGVLYIYTHAYMYINVPLVLMTTMHIHLHSSLQLNSHASRKSTPSVSLCKRCWHIFIYG